MDTMDDFKYFKEEFSGEIAAQLCIANALNRCAVRLEEMAITLEEAGITGSSSPAS